ncbi:MAG: nucleotidyltransferase family protein [Chitinophagaceae bacterium]|nr:nucleotidyltransferase family protein [Chitinophagaceae bacterium]
MKLKPELAAKYHVKSLGLFGSVVRNDFTPQSDIDIIVDFDQPVGIEFIDLANYMEGLFLTKVDLVSRKGIKDKYFQLIEKEIIYV